MVEWSPRKAHPRRDAELPGIAESAYRVLSLEEVEVCQLCGSDQPTYMRGHDATTTTPGRARDAAVPEVAPRGNRRPPRRPSLRQRSRASRSRCRGRRLRPEGPHAKKPGFPAERRARAARAGDHVAVRARFAGRSMVEPTADKVLKLTSLILLMIEAIARFDRAWADDMKVLGRHARR
jgi:hypothetical protein